MPRRRRAAAAVAAGGVAVEAVEAVEVVASTTNALMGRAAPRQKRLLCVCAPPSQ